MNVKIGKPMKLSFKRTIDASPSQVFDIWMNGKGPGVPWHKAAIFIRKPVKDGLYYFLTQKNPEGYPHYGRYLKIQKNKLVKQTWMSPFTHGRESIVTLSLKSVGGKTALTLLHEKLSNDDYGLAHQGGWEDLLGQLVEHFSSTKAKKV